jgi:hypothetical protein
VATTEEKEEEEGKDAARVPGHRRGGSKPEVHSAKPPSNFENCRKTLLEPSRRNDGESRGKSVLWEKYPF